MSGEGTPPAPQNLDDLPALALSRPHEALTLARTLLANHPSSRVAAAAHHAIGVVLREFGAIDEALAEFRTGMHRARQATDIARVADIRASYGVALLLAGRTRRGLAEIEAAAGDAVGEAAGRIEVRRAYGLLLLGDYREMLRAAQRAVVLLAHGDPVWEARAHNHRAVAHLALGAVALADRDYARAEELFARAGQRLEYAIARHDRAVAAFARGDLPAALTLLDDAQRVIDELDVFEPDLSITRAQVLLAAGLDRDALRVADEGVVRSERLRGSAMRRGELLFVAAMAARAGGDVATAAERSREALRMFRRQQRPRWAARAELVLLESRFDGGETSPELLRKADRLAGTLERLALTGALEAHVLAGRIALACGKDDVGARHLRAAAARRPRDLRARATGWLARAVLAEAEARPADLLAACARGLDLVDAHLRTLGATELRAQATAQGADLARLALRQAAQAGDARRLLQWSERWRATALAAPPVRLDPDAEMTRDLAVLRSLARRLESAQAGDPAIPVLLQERRRLEEAVRRQALRQPGGARGRTASIRLGELRDLLGDATLVELTDVGGELFAITLAGRRPPAMHHVGGVAAADRVLAHALFALRRGATRRSTAPLDLRPIGERLQATMLGPVASTLRAPAVVVVPTGRLHAVPWNLLPALRGRAVTV
ncbi:MAG: CHAT domain-containing protein, partial [Kineosporiaceae bacterium]